MVFPLHLSFQIDGAEAKLQFRSTLSKITAKLFNKTIQVQAHEAHLASLDSDGEEQVALLIVL